ncbi:YjbQ family protein [Actinocrinis puniceicyclus]|uniref:YjbQ family protein n=1 Tax=Actinocrinis puniceicyclus TaxID=977794 RepID=A0A8J8BCX7_9ACTN|nr:YjbQ family protein [Actinocrinis puniceicyclus]MBS2963985.1 YjbQ family protein [Actinocrinis puniceicyclus]
MESGIVRIETGSRLVTDVTGRVVDACRGRGDGLVNLFVPHATCGLALMETGSGSEDDLAGILDDLLPPVDRYRHRHGSTGHGRDHVLPAFISPSLSLPVLGGEPQLGTWQSVVIVDSNTDNRTRTLRISFLAG